MQLLDPFFCLKAFTANNDGDSHRILWRGQSPQMSNRTSGDSHRQSCLARLFMVKIGLSGAKNSTPKKPKGP